MFRRGDSKRSPAVERYAPARLDFDFLHKLKAWSLLARQNLTEIATGNLKAGGKVLLLQIRFREISCKVFHGPKVS